jgi:hypothetical protein
MIACNVSVQAIKAFCVGQAKSGTGSLAALLTANHRAAHEPEREQILEMILRESRGDVSDNDFRSGHLASRDIPHDVRAFLSDRPPLFSPCYLANAINQTSACLGIV